jgi:hypothetical protein
MSVHAALSPDERMEIFARFQRFGDQHGFVTELAQEWDVSRHFVYDLGKRVRDAVVPARPGRKVKDRSEEIIERLRLRVAHLEAERDTLAGELEMQRLDRSERRFRLLMELALCPVSTDKISRCLEAAFGQTLSPSRIAATIARAGEAALSLMQRRELREALKDVALDETFSGKRPILTLVEPNSLMAVVPQATENRKGETWREVLDQYPNLEFAVSDQGSGLLKGLELRGRHISRQADLFHFKRSLRREARRLEEKCYRAIERVDEARAVTKEPRLTWTARLCAVEEYRRQAASLDRMLEAFDWYEVILDYLDEQLSVYDWRADRVRTREAARLGIEDVLTLLAEIKAIETRPTMSLIEGVKYELVTFLRVLSQRLRKIEIRWAVVTGSREAALAAICRVWYRRSRAGISERDQQAYLTALTGLEYWRRRIENFAETVGAVFEAMDSVVRASSAVECLNSIIRPYAAVKKQLSQKFLALIALYWDMHGLENRRGRTPFQEKGVSLGTEDWIEALELEMSRMRLVESHTA